VNVAANAPASVTNTATVSGAGDVNTANNTANDVTTINRGSNLTPTLVQHVASSANPLGIGLGGGPVFNMPLPNPVRAGNCLILGVSYAWSATRTVAITDNNGNTWPATPAVTANPGVDTVSAIYVLANANAGQTTVTVTFDAALIPFQYTISEFYNVAAASPVNGTSSTAQLPGAALTTGAFTPANNDATGGNLIWSYFALGQSTASQNPSLWTPGTGFTLLDADIAWNTSQGFPHASEYFVQTTSTAINPGITASGDTNSFNCLSVALKAATAGTAPPATGIRIVRIIHMTSNVPPANTTWPLQVPTIGNLIVVAMNESSPVINVTGITDNKSNSYTLRELDAGSPQIWHTANSTPDANLRITLTISGNPATASVVAYDIVGANASPFDVVAGVAPTAFNNQTHITNAPSITPTTTNGLVIAAISMGQGPITQLDTGSPAGAVFDLVTYTGETDFDLMENADGKGHLYNTDLTQENWNWLGHSAASNTYSATAVAFKAAPVGLSGLTADASSRYGVPPTDTASTPSPHSNVAEGFAGLSVSPRAAALTFTRSQQFTANSSGVVWSVDGAIGGSVSSGTITAAGLYSPPTTVGTHIVTATASGTSVSGDATVYITDYPGTFTHHNDPSRTGQNPNETVLTPANVNSSTFGKLYSYQLDGTPHASPLYAANVHIPGKGLHNVVYVATEHDTVYAFDADGSTSSPLWQVSTIGPSAGITNDPASDTGELGDTVPEIGISGTPVIDQASSTLYVVSKEKAVVDGVTNYVQRLHALDITTGAEKFGGPVEIQASVPGTADGAQGGQVPFIPLRENHHPALLLSRGVVYIGVATHGDNSPWHGWALGYNATTLQQVLAHTPANLSGGGIWQGGGGLAADSAGAIYFVTGYADLGANTGDVDYRDSIVRMSPSGTVLDYFAPRDQLNLQANDLDLGSGSLLLLPDQPGPHPHLVVYAGKGGTVYLVNRDNMGHYNPNDDNQIVQSLANIFPEGGFLKGNFSAPVYFNGHVYFSPTNDTIQAFQLNNGLLSTAPASRSSEVYTYPGGALALSADGNPNGILGTVQGNGVTAPGVLRAYDPSDLSIELYNSDQAGSRDTLDLSANSSIPVVANGKVFVGSVSQLTVYGLLPD
jgi:hypothetical protein